MSGIGPNGDGFSKRMYIRETKDGTGAVIKSEGVFELNVATTIPPNKDYRLCWCQASIMPCELHPEFIFDIGYVKVVSETSIWPSCLELEVNFYGWRGPPWSTLDDCCCNFWEAG